MEQTSRKEHFEGETHLENETRDFVDYDKYELILELMNDEFNYLVSIDRKREEEENYEDEDEDYEEYDEIEYDDEEHEYEDEDY